MSFVGFISGLQKKEQAAHKAAIKKAVVQTYSTEGEDIDWLIEDEAHGKWDFVERPMLMKAIKRALAGDMIFCISTLKGFGERQWQGMDFLSQQAKEHGLNLLVADEPTMTGSTITFLALAGKAQRERMVAKSQAALTSIKQIIDREGEYISKKGRTIKKLGRHDKVSEASQKGADVGFKRARSREEELWPLIKDCRDRGMNYSETARHLTNMGIPTLSEMGKHKRTTKGIWHPNKVRAIIIRREK